MPRRKEERIVDASRDFMYADAVHDLRGNLAKLVKPSVHLKDGWIHNLGPS